MTTYSEVHSIYTCMSVCVWGGGGGGESYGIGLTSEYSVEFELRICVDGNERFSTFLTNCKVGLTGVNLQKQG